MWQCIHCDERIDESFEVCWKCGANREGRKDEGFAPVADDPSVPDPGPPVEDDAPRQAPLNPYLAPALLEEHAVAPHRVEERLRAIRRFILLLCLVCSVAGVLYLFQFGIRLWEISVDAPEYLTRFWEVFGYLYWRLPLSAICFANAYILWRYAVEIRNVVSGDANTFDAMFRWQRIVWTMVVVTVGYYLMNEVVTILLMNGFLRTDAGW